MPSVTTATHAPLIRCKNRIGSFATRLLAPDPADSSQSNKRPSQGKPNNERATASELAQAGAAGNEGFSLPRGAAHDDFR
jgi:hypothetical protein